MLTFQLNSNLLNSFGLKKMLDKSNFSPLIAVADKILKPFGGMDTFCTNLQLSLEIKSRILQRFDWHMATYVTCRMPQH